MRSVIAVMIVCTYLAGSGSSLHTYRGGPSEAQRVAPGGKQGDQEKEESSAIDSAESAIKT
jgi:hypothetical protein